MFCDNKVSSCTSTASATVVLDIDEHEGVFPKVEQYESNDENGQVDHHCEKHENPTDINSILNKSNFVSTSREPFVASSSLNSKCDIDGMNRGLVGPESEASESVHSVKSNTSIVFRSNVMGTNTNNKNCGDSSDNFSNFVNPEDEADLRRKATHGRLYLLVWNTYASFVIFFSHLITLESLISIAISVYFTIYTYNKIIDTEELSYKFNGNIMSWTLLSFAVITPISAAVSMAFRRREQALQQIMTLRATLIQLYSSHSSWDWEFKRVPVVCDDESQTMGSKTVTRLSTGRQRSSVDWLNHSDKVYAEILHVADEVTRFLTLPSSSRGRHRTTTAGKTEAQHLDRFGERLKTSIMRHMANLTTLCEILKQEGLPGNESSRIRQWECIIVTSIENLHSIKMYRTPQGLRSFARLFSMLLPPFYAPYYASVAIELNSLGVAITFSCFTAIALTSLFETVNQMEDPFDELPPLKDAVKSLDGINVRYEMIDTIESQLQMLRKEFFPLASRSPPTAVSCNKNGNLCQQKSHQKVH